jgi:hypothetical protein
LTKATITIHLIPYSAIRTIIFWKVIMQLWQHLLAVDQRHDLAACRSSDAIIRLEHSLAAFGFDAAPAWRRNVLTLRSLARHLRGQRLKRGRSECLSLPEALTVLDEHLSALRVVALPQGKPCRVAICPTKADGTPLPELWPLAGRAFWPLLFLNMLDGRDHPVCTRCGKDLPAATPTGRAVRRRFCSGCYSKNWRSNQPPEAMRQRWRDDKRKAKQKLNPTNSEQHL